jgi:16S rRNA G966 N2-methylase RsmD
LAKTPPFCDIDLERWREYDEIYTDSLWLFDRRDRSGGHSLDYHGNFIPQIATQVYTRYTCRDDVILDLFLGSGTSALEAMRMGRRCIGVELKADLVEHVRAKVPPHLRDPDRPDQSGQIRILKGDSQSPETRERVQGVLDAWQRSHAQLVMLHPPYHDIIRFSDSPRDLSNAEDTETFLAQFAAVARNACALLEPGRFACLVIGDKYARGELIPLGFLCMQQMNEAGFSTKAIVVKDIQGNEHGKGRSSNLWRYRALAGGYYVFKHEYVIILQKPA